MSVNKSLRILLAASFILASGGWATAAVNIANSPATQSWSPRLAVDAQGNVHAVWLELTGGENGDIWYAKGNRDGTSWSTPINLSNTNAVWTGTLQVCGIDTDQNNNVYVIYTDGPAVKLRIYEGGAWGSPITLDTSPGDRCDSPRVQVTPGGDIFTVWFYSGWRYIYSRARVNGVWEDTRFLNAGRTRAKITDIAIGTNIVAVTWTEMHESLDIYQVAHIYRSRTYNASWSSVTRVAPENINQQYPCVEVDSNDISHVVWTPDFGGNRIVYYVQGSGGSFSAPVALSGEELLHYPSMAERNNNIYVCWQVGGYGGGETIDFNNKVSGTWQGRGEVPSSSGGTFADVAVSRYEDRRYYAWEANNDISVHTYIIQVSTIQPTITGTVRTPTGSGLSSVTLSGLPASPTTPASGVYSDAVYAGWSGTVTPVRSGYTFSPAGRSYSDVIANRIVQDYVGASDGCTYNIAPSLQTFVKAGGAGSVTVTAGAGCAWSAASQSAWIVIDSGSSGSGNGTVQFTVSANSGGARTGTLIVAGQTVTVHQQGDFLFNVSSAYVVVPEAVWMGTSGGAWISEVQITDVTGGSWVSAYFSYGGGNRRGPIYVWNNTGGDKRSVKFSNILSYLGTVDTGFSYYGRIGALEFVTQDANHTIQVLGRTSKGAGSRMDPGLVPAPENTAFVSQPLLIQNLSNNSGLRVKCSFFNPTTSSVTAEFRLLNTGGATIGSAFTRTLVGYDFQTFNPFALAGVPYPGTSSSNANLVVTPTSGSGALVGIGTSITNATDDPAAHLAAQYQGSLQNSPSSDVIIPECLWKTSGSGDTWTTGALITDFTGGSIVSVYFSDSAGTRRGPFAIWTNTGGAGQSIATANILATLDAVDTGATYFGKTGALELLTQDSSHKIHVMARVRNGTSSMMVPGFRATDGTTADTSRQLLVQNLMNNLTYRANCAFYNPTASSVTVEFRLYASDGSSVGSAFSKTFAAYGFQTFSPFNDAGAPYPGSSHDNVILIVRPTSGSGKVLGFGFTVHASSRDPNPNFAVQYR